MYTYLQQATSVEYAVVDKKKVSQEEHKPIAEYDDASVENKVIQKGCYLCEYVANYVFVYIKLTSPTENF